MKLAIKDSKGNPAGEHEVRFEVIENGRGSQAVHDTVVAFQAGRRRGTAATKTMGEVNGSGKKPWRQKGTGRARAGSFASPLWRGGGVTHGPQPRDFSKKVNKKVASLALRKALSERLKAGDVVVVDSFALDVPKTKAFQSILDQLGVIGTTLIVVAGESRNVELAARNLPLVGLAVATTVNTYELLRYDKIVITKDAFEQIEARLAR
jgi:large subunit ribosomal protein L4